MQRRESDHSPTPQMFPNTNRTCEGILIHTTFWYLQFSSVFNSPLSSNIDKDHISPKKEEQIDRPLQPQKCTDILLLQLIKMYQHFTPTALNMSRFFFTHQMIYTAALTSQRRSSRTFLKYTDILLLPLIKMYQHFTPTAKKMSRFLFNHQMIYTACAYINVYTPNVSTFIL